MAASIIIAMDSRGANLNRFLHSHHLELPQHKYNNKTIVIPGAQLNTLKNAIDKTIQTSKNHTNTIIIAAGICNLTHKVHHATGMEVTYTHTPEKVASIIANMEQIYTNFHQKYNSQTTFACIPPVSLTKHKDFNKDRNKLSSSIFTTEETQLQQKHLEEDIKQLNQAIIHINNSHSLRSIRWDRDIMKTTTKLRGRNKQNRKQITKFTYKHLYDGIHPNILLANKWYTFLCRAVTLDSTNKLSELSSSDDDQDEADSWDFKRTTTQQ